MDYALGSISIGELSRQTGCKVPTIRYYEKIGMMPEPVRTQGNQRRFDERHVQRLRFIRHGRELGFAPDSIRDLLTLSDNPAQPCEQADAIAKQQLANVERRLTQLNALRDELKRMIVQCKGGTIADCQIIEILSNHDKCLNDNHAVDALP